MVESRLNGRDISTKFITPALRGTGWNEMLKIQEVSFTKRRIIVCARLISHGRVQRADYER